MAIVTVVLAKARLTATILLLFNTLLIIKVLTARHWRVRKLIRHLTTATPECEITEHARATTANIIHISL